jgi:hypothetical protein
MRSLEGGIESVGTYRDREGRFAVFFRVSKSRKGIFINFPGGWYVPKSQKQSQGSFVCGLSDISDPAEL